MMPASSARRARAATQAVALCGALLGVPFGFMTPLGCPRAWGAEPEVARNAEGAVNDDAFADLDLGKLLQMDEVTVASVKGTSLREAPGIVTVITHDDIVAAAPRDLIDLLETVPGFFVGVDVQGITDVGIRGNWGHEGKILLIIDGLEINELAYGTLALGHHFPMEAIERIEIIRGPGSAIYGGFAELAVIKVTTRAAEQLEGVETVQRLGLGASAAAGRSGTAFESGFGDVYVAGGRSYGDFELSLSAFVGRSVRSDGTYTDIYGTAVPMATSSERRPLMLNLGVAWKDWRLRLLADDYTFRAQDNFDVAGATPAHYRFGGLYGDVTTSLRLGRGVALIPRLAYKAQESYYSLVDSAAERAQLIADAIYDQRRYDRAVASLAIRWDVTSRLNAIAGGEAFYDVGRVMDRSPDVQDVVYFHAPDLSRVDSVSFTTMAAFAQALWNTPIANVTFGGRVERHSYFGTSAVPRLAVTRVFPFGLHVKLLASQAFKTPTIMNIDLERTVDPQNRIHPERTSVLEAEIGYQPRPALALVANGFYSIIRDPIIYTYNAAANREAYFNRDRTGSFGAEGEARWKSRGGAAALAASYSYYHALAGVPTDYAVPGSGAMLAAPQHKLVLRAQVRPAPRWLLGATVIATSKRYAVTSADADGGYVISALDPKVLVGLTVHRQDLLVKGLGVGVSVYDLLDQREVFAQPYASGHAPLPAMGRQVMLRLSYSWER